MRKILCLIFLVICENAYSQVSQVEWQHCIGGSDNDVPATIIPLADGNILMVGNTNSTDGVSTPNHGIGSYDILVCKLDSSGNMIWRKCFGGSNDDSAYSAVHCSDGGFIVAGSTNSFDGDITGFHFSTNASPDGWIIKLDSMGSIQWTKCLGGSSRDIIYSILQLSDGNFLCSGTTMSIDGDVLDNHDPSGTTFDAWIIKLNSTGNIIWKKCFGSDDINSVESANCIIETKNHNYVFAGSTGALGGDVYNFNGFIDVWLAGTDTSGNLLFSNCYGGSYWEEAFSVIETSDGGFFISGKTASDDGDVTGHHVNMDYWMVRTDSSGNLLWTRCAGGDGDDFANFGMQTMDGGFLVIGDADGTSGDITSSYGYQDVWLVKLDSAGTIAWQKTYGGNGFESGKSLFEKNGAIFFSSLTASANTGLVTLQNGGEDIWIVKLLSPVSTGEINPPGNILTVTPNPAHGKISVHLNSMLNKNSVLKVQIYDDRGSLVLHQNIANTVFFNLSVENFSAGVYILKLEENDSQNYFSKKFIIE